MHPHQSRSMLRYLLLALLVTALIVLFPVTAKSHHDIAELNQVIF
jgi:hypothetical protein